MYLLHSPAKKSRLDCALIAATSLLLSSLAYAEAPMNVDDAGTLDKGGMKLEAVWSKDDKTKGGGLLFGFSPIEKLEFEVALARAEDGSASPDTKLRDVGFGAKWVPYQNETGWSLGARFDYGRSRVTDYATPDQFTAREYAVSGLATYRFGNGQVAHLNLGATRLKAQGTADTAGTWGLGYEFPLRENLQLTAETFGMEHSRPDKALGLRYEISDGVKISGAIGRGSARSFGQVGIAWEF